MIPGYNHNVSYKGRVFHVQTEDSGVQNPHIITHIFVGGNIVESRKTSYGDIVDSSNLNEMLVELMQNQHKALLKDLVRGTLDGRIETRSVNASSLDGPAPLNVEAGAQHRASLLVPGEAVTQPSAPPPPTEQPTERAASPVAQQAVPPPIPPRPPVRPAPAATPAAGPESLLDGPPSSFFGDAPPATSVTKVLEAATLEAAFNSADDKAVDSIFGEDLISDRSLDEVILSYLAEDITTE